MIGWNGNGRSAVRRNSEFSGAFGGTGPQAQRGISESGLPGDLHVASNLGWRSLDSLSVGDQVLTFDHGMQIIGAIRRSEQIVAPESTPEHLWPVHVPVNALGNRQPLTMLPDQGVLVESEAAIDAQGDPFAVVPVQALVGYHGIVREPPEAVPQMIYHLDFDSDQVVYAEGGLLVHCPAGDLVLDMIGGAFRSAYNLLPLSEARFLAECMVVDSQLSAYSDAQMRGL